MEKNETFVIVPIRMRQDMFEKVKKVAEKLGTTVNKLGEDALNLFFQEIFVPEDILKELNKKPKR